MKFITDKNSSPNTVWERFSQTTKDSVCSTIFFCLLLLIESLQLFYYSIHSTIPNLFNTDFLQFVQITVRYFHTDYVLIKSQEAVYLSLLIIAAIYLLILVVVTVICVVNLMINKRRNSAVLNYLLKTLSLMIILYLTVLEMPMFQLFVTPILCSSQSTYNPTKACFSGSHSAYFAVGLICLLIYLALFAVFVTLYGDINPCSSIPFAGPQSRMIMAKSAFKMLIVVFFNLDYQGKYVSYFIGVCAACFLLILGYRYKRIVYFRRSINSFSAVCDTAVTWAYICVLIHVIFNDGSSSIGLVYMAILSPFACISYMFLMDKRKFYVIKSNAKSLKKTEDVEIFVNVVLELVERSESDNNRIKLEGMLRNYQRSLTSDSAEAALLKELTDENASEEPADKLNAWYRLVLSIIEQSLKKFAKNPRLRLLLAYIQHEKLKNKYKSLFELMQAAEVKPNYQEEFSIFRYKLIIEEEMIELDMRTNNEMNGMDVNQMVLFQNHFVKFLGTIEKAVELHHDFWKELTEDNPDIKKLESLGSGITRIVEDSRKQFDVLNDINSNHHKTLEIFGRFLKEVVNDETNGQRIIEKAEKASRQASQRQAGEDPNKIEENSDTAIITISGNFREIGIITNCNSQITTLLGYTKSEVVKQKIETIMPKIFADNHDHLLFKYFDNPDRQLNIERTVYAINKKGYIVPCSLLAKILPNLDNGIQLVGFLKELGGFDPDRDKYIAYSPESGMIYGVSKACYTHFGIRASLTYGRCHNMSELNFEMICPELLEEGKLTALKSTNGCNVTVDTTSILNNHPLENDDDESVNEAKFQEKEDEEVKAGETRAKRYRKYSRVIQGCVLDSHSLLVGLSHRLVGKYQNVRARILEDRKWFDGKLRVNVVKLWENKDTDLGEESNDEEKDNLSQDRDKKVEQVEQEQVAEGPVNESVGDVGSSQISNQDNNADLKNVKDTRAIISEKNVPRTIKNLNRIFYVFILLVMVVSALLIYFLAIEKSKMANANNAIMVSNNRHSLLAGLNYFVRKLYLIHIGAFTSIATASAGFTSTQTSIRTLSDLLQQVQFSVVEAEHNLNTDLGASVSITDITNYALTESGTSSAITTIRSAYESVLFQYTSETFQINNASNTDVVQAWERYGSPSTTSESAQNVRKAFDGIFYNGLRDLRSTSQSTSQEILKFYLDEATKNFNIKTLLISCIGMFVVLAGTFLLIPTVFQVMKTTKLVLALFRRMAPADIAELAKKCEKFQDEMLSDGEKKKVLESIKTNNQPESDTATNNQTNVNGQLKKSDENVHAIPILDKEGRPIDPALPIQKSLNPEEEAFDIKTEKPVLVPIQNNMMPLPIVQMAPEGGSEKKSARDNRPDHKKLNPNLSIGENLDEKAGLRAEDGKPEPGTKKKAGGRKEDGKTKSKQKAEDEQNAADDEDESVQRMINSKERLTQQTILMFIVFGLLLLSPFVIIVIWQSVVVSQQKTLFNHFSSLCMLNSNIKYTLVFAQETIANLTLLKVVPDYPNDYGAEHYNKATYEAFSSTASILEASVPPAFSDYVNTYKTVIYTNACDPVPQLRTGSPKLDLDVCKASGFMGSGVYTSATQILTRSNDIFQNTKLLLADPANQNLPNTQKLAKTKSTIETYLGASSNLGRLLSL